jgi:hypothetical protein
MMTQKDALVFAIRKIQWSKQTHEGTLARLLSPRSRSNTPDRLAAVRARIDTCSQAIVVLSGMLGEAIENIQEEHAPINP